MRCYWNDFDKVRACEANDIFAAQRTSKNSIAKESTTRDVVREKMTSGVEEGELCAMQWRGIVA